MNQLDLLYTNSFVRDNDNINYDKNTQTTDRINQLKTIDQPFPKNYNRNHEPLISDAVRDIVKDRYKKYKITDVLIDSRDRNYELYPVPNKYMITLSRQFTNVESMTLLAVDFGSLPITKTKITWSTNFANIFSINIPTGIYSTQNLANTLSKSMSSIPDENGNIQNIDVSINAELNDIKIINRINIPKIVAIQTILQPSDDILNNLLTPSDNGIYITVKYQFTNLNYPLIPTNISQSQIGGFVNTLFNYNEFWNGSSSTNEYKFIDSFIIGGIKYYRYLLIPRINTSTFSTTTAENIILSQPISQYLINVGKYDFTFSNNCCDSFSSTSFSSTIGEAQDFMINFDHSPIMNIFGWYECSIDTTKYVQTNNSNDNISKTKCFDIYKDFNGEYIFKIEPYILLKLESPSYAADTIGGNIIKSQNISNDINGIKNVSNIFAKLDINSTTGKAIGNNPNLSNQLKFYETPIEKLNELMIIFVDANGIPIDLKCDQDIVIRIVESVDVLKDTLIDSRHGEAITTGIRYTF